MYIGAMMVLVIERKCCHCIHLWTEGSVIPPLLHLRHSLNPMVCISVWCKVCLFPDCPFSWVNYTWRRRTRDFLFFVFKYSGKGTQEWTLITTLPHHKYLIFPLCGPNWTLNIENVDQTGSLQRTWNNSFAILSSEESNWTQEFSVNYFRENIFL